jgi:hypothetical protein
MCYNCYNKNQEDRQGTDTVAKEPISSASGKTTCIGKNKRGLKCGNAAMNWPDEPFCWGCLNKQEQAERDNGLPLKGCLGHTGVGKKCRICRVKQIPGQTECPGQAKHK